MVTDVVFVGDVHNKTLFRLENHLPFLSPLVESGEVITQGHVIGVAPDLFVNDTVISEEPHM